jgi:DnaJ-class molecular chaperone
VTDAFDVLADEERRALYDKLRDHVEAHPNKGLPPLTKEEAVMLRAGAGELSRLRRAGPKLGKHPSLQRDVPVALAKLNAGCTKAVAVERRRVDYSGRAFVSAKTFHLVIRRGSREGDRLVFEEEGDETVDTSPGDLVCVTPPFVRLSQGRGPTNFE